MNSSLSGQDLHFSQFYNAPLNISPALTGIFTGDQRFVGTYRNQWATVPVSYTTFAASYDQKFYFPFTGEGFFGGGMIFTYDRAGDADLNWSQIGFNLSYTQPLNDENSLSVGMEFKFGQRAFQPDALTFDDQFNGDVFDPNMPTMQTFAQTSSGFFDLGAGALWNYHSEDSRQSVIVGLSFAHLTQPVIGFLEDSSVSVPMVTRTFVFGTIPVTEAWDINLMGMGQIQLPYSELLVGSTATYHMPLEKGDELMLTAGIAYRNADALIAIVEGTYQNWRLGFSYDINISDFEIATGNVGGPELAVRYIISKVKSPGKFKACPIF
jgi:type IX secretion system PorP/SprF family membrane protein